MTPDQAMTGTFKLKLPEDLLDAVQHNPVDRGNDMTVVAMRPSLVERVIGLFSRRKKSRRR
jgi:hypothetical protein